MKSLKSNLFADWTLFLDRDGVINKRIPDSYVKYPKEFILLPGALQSISAFSKIFKYIIIVTNQAGISKGYMTQQELATIHQLLRKLVRKNGGRIDAIFYCPYHSSENAECRKPNSGMALQAKAIFPSIDFQKSIIVGDSPSDMEFGKKLNMKTIFVETDKTYESADIKIKKLADLCSTKSVLYRLVK